jgi:predicted transcriptional regulator
MTKRSISIRLDEEKKQALDKIAKYQDRDRSYIINEAIDHYLDLRQWQEEHMLKGLVEANAGKFATDEEVEAAFARFYQ